MKTQQSCGINEAAFAIDLKTGKLKGYATMSDGRFYGAKTPNELPKPLKEFLKSWNERY